MNSKIKMFFYFLFISFQSFAQMSTEETTLFRFKGNNSDLVLYHNLSSHAVESRASSSNSFNARQGYLEAFIIQPVNDDSGKVYIISAKSPEFYLRRDHLITNNSQIEGIRFSTLSAGDNLDLFEWEIVVGEEYSSSTTETIPSIFLIKTPEFDNFGLELTNAGIFRLSEWKNSQNMSLTPQADIENIKTTFQFIFEKVANVF